jgi:hypothetical protein
MVNYYLSHLFNSLKAAQRFAAHSALHFAIVGSNLVYVHYFEFEKK